MELEAETLARPAVADVLVDSVPVASPLVLLREIVADARARGATRVHLEAAGEAFHVRLRVAGALVEARRLSPANGTALVESLGGERICVGGRDLIAARLATPRGPRAVLHLVGDDEGSEPLESLGMRPRLVRALDTAFARGGGLVLVAGPPGSGRRTTRDAIARHLDNGTRCLLAVESGPAIGDAFRTVMRQDPDVISAPAIDDRETARAAVAAAEAGHLVLATIEARDAVDAILRLRALRVEPFQLASTLQAVIAQRLVDRLCRACREPVQAQGSVSALLGFDPGAVVYSPVGCAACGGTGFDGRTAVFEAIHADAPLRRLINDGGDGAIIARHAFLNAPNLGSAARTLVREGVTTPEEAVRVSRS